MKKRIKTETRKVPFKNYVITLLMFVGAILLTLYIFKWYQVKIDEKLSKNYLIDNKYVDKEFSKFSEVDSIITEAPSKLFLYITYRNDKKIYNIEKKYDSIFNKYNLQDSFYIFDITDLKESNDDYLKIINNKLDINVSGLPVLIYYEDGQINSYKKIKNYKDFEKLIKKYNVDKK